MISRKLKNKVKFYVNNNFKKPIIKEVRERMYKMYMKQIEHIIEMNERINKLDRTSFFLFSLEKTNEFDYENEDELLAKAINSVNNIFKKHLSHF